MSQWKQILAAATGLILMTVLPGWATTYYFSASGNDARSAAQAQHPNTPWRSLAKLEEIMPSLLPGDSVLFRRGDVFYGSIRVTKSGEAGRPILFAAYGSGAQPIIDGGVLLTNWRSTGVTNRWQTTCDTCQTIPALYQGQQVLPVGRFPNRGAANDGYLTIQQGNGRNRFTGTGISGASWVGAEAVIRSSRWTLDRSRVSQQSGNTLTLAENTTYSIPAAFGFFLQNHPATLDRVGEWCYEASRRRITWYTNLANPNRTRVFASFHPYVLDIRGKQHIHVNQLMFRRARISNLYLWGNNNIVLSGLRISQGAADGLQMNNCQRSTIARCTFDQNADNGLVVKNSEYITIRDNELTETGTIAGQGGSGNGSYSAIIVTGNRINVVRNTITQTGYVGVDFRGSNMKVNNNRISDFCTIKDDGAGIYTWASAGEQLVNRQVKDNIVLHGGGAERGTDHPEKILAEGIYLDDRTHNVEVAHNTVAYCGESGIYVHNSRDISLHHNTLFDNRVPVKMISNGEAGNQEMQIRRCQIRYNTLVSVDQAQPLIELVSKDEDVVRFATFNSNRYVHPFRPYGNFQVTQRLGSPERTDHHLSLRSWKRFSGQDAASTLSPRYYQNFRVLETRGANPFTNASFDSTITEWTSWARYGNADVKWHAAGHGDAGSVQVGFSSLTGQRDAKLLLSGHHANLTVRAGVHYRLQLSVKGSQDDQPVKLILRKSGGDRSELASTHTLYTHTDWKQYEFIFAATSSSTSARLDVQVTEDDGTIWIDQVSLQPVRVEYSQPRDSVRFVYNPDTQPLAATLSVPRVGTDFRSYTSSAEVPPYRSLVLLRDETSIILANDEGRAAEPAEPQGATHSEERDPLEAERSSDEVVRHSSSEGGAAAEEPETVADPSRGEELITGLDEYEPFTDPVLQLYPNPTRRRVTLSYKTESAGMVRTVVSDAQGRIVYQSSQLMGQGTHTSAISVLKFPRGWYAVRVMTTDQVYQQRLIVQ